MKSLLLLDKSFPRFLWQGDNIRKPLDTRHDPSPWAKTDERPPLRAESKELSSENIEDKEYEVIKD